MTVCLLGDRYQLGDTFGRGGMSVVHRGRDVRMGRQVAIKLLRSELARDPCLQVRFRREARNAGTLNHPAIVAVYDAGEMPVDGGGVPYIVMEYVDGETLREVLTRDGPLPPRRAMLVVADICAALDFSHRHGIIHRDIKPGNVMLDRAGAVKVMDFGIARAVTDGDATMTSASATIGTAHYLSPEQARGLTVDARTDVYATGCVLYELLTGLPPFVGDSPVQVAYRHVREAPQAPSAQTPGLAPELDTIVLNALNKNPLNRYQSAAEMRSDLLRACSGQALHATAVLSNEERHELMGAAATHEDAAGSAPLLAPLLAPPVFGASEWVRQPETENRPKRGWALAGAGALGLALALAVWLTLRVIIAPSVPHLVAVPDLSGMTLSQATAQLQVSRLALGAISPIESAAANKDKVVVQRPSSQTEVSQDSTVNLEMGTVAGH